MKLSPGDTVIHPHHGPATVVATLERQVRGEAVAYVDLEVHDGGMRVSIPASQVEDVGLRPPASRAELERLAAVLSGPSEPVERQWSRRVKAERDVLLSGDPMKLAALVRDLLRRRENGHLGQAEREILREASAPLLAEVALSVGCDEERAREVTRALILEQSTEILALVDPHAA